MWKKSKIWYAKKSLQKFSIFLLNCNEKFDYLFSWFFSWPYFLSTRSFFLFHLDCNHDCQQGCLQFEEAKVIVTWSVSKRSILKGLPDVNLSKFKLLLVKKYTSKLENDFTVENRDRQYNRFYSFFKVFICIFNSKSSNWTRLI